MQPPAGPAESPVPTAGAPSQAGSQTWATQPTPGLPMLPGLGSRAEGPPRAPSWPVLVASDQQELTCGNLGPRDVRASSGAPGRGRGRHLPCCAWLCWASPLCWAWRRGPRCACPGSSGCRATTCWGGSSPWARLRTQASATGHSPTPPRAPGKMAVEEINRGSSLLPGTLLGYDFFDTCSDPVVAIKPSLMFMAKAGGRDVAAHCDYSQHQPRVLAVIGPQSSELALITGKLFGFFLMPQVSYGASMDKLSDREAFPSFFRTVPSDQVQATAMVELLLALHWNWVAALASDEEYGRQGLSLFSSLASTKGICIAQEGLVPLPGVTGEQLGTMWDLLRQVNQSSVEVVVLFSSARAARTLFSYSIRSRLSPKVWVASEAWLTSDLVMTLPGMAQVGTVLGFLQQGAPLPDFESYVQTRLAMAADPAFCASLDSKRPGPEDHVVGPRCPQCDHISLDNVSASLRHHQTFAAYAAVYAVAQALHNTLLCGTSGCPAREPVQPWQLLENMYNMSFQASGLELRFDTSGNVDLGYDLKLWVWQDQIPELRTVGSFDGRLQLQPSRMNWHTPRNTMPMSQCSRRCEEGQVRRVKGFHSCCYDCVDCTAGSYQRSPDDLLCTQCEQDQWSPDKSLRCFPRKPKFLAWGEPATLLLLALLGLVLGLVLAALGLFVWHRDSPLVRASGGPRACFGLACLGLVCLSALLFPGRPSPAHCLAQQPLLHLPLSGCLSTLVLQAAEVFVESELPSSWAARLRSHLRGPQAWLAVLLAVLVEAVLCAWSLGAFPPEVVTDWQVLPTEALVHCRMRSWVGFGLLHTANATLALLCFLGTFLVRSQPGRYNGARSLTFATLAYFITWVSFVPLFANVPVVHQPTVQMGASLLCALGILGTFHLPKCCLLLWQSESNTPEFFLGGVPGDARGHGGSRGGQETEQKPVAHDPVASPH
ncbi:taste receptor type 1 member 3 isoform X2 [Artibeus jamaicensis]|uniref:taste receptor type 1 member 3 isoform X2 n=1 Tax=Artibeus jamaicensis TaxID=9417 RepID=UPI00235AAC27|nr:taste receptor type 1 member 3 isoform X2 [Artibeus jamaicensis]